MGRVFKYLFYLALLALAVVIGFAFLSDLPPPAREIIIDVTPSSRGG